MTLTLVEELEARKVQQAKTSPNYCKVYARRTPLLPYHNGWMVSGDKCSGCGKMKA